MAQLTVVYDACVLYPAPLRDLLMSLTQSGLFHARWTDQIHDEWMRNLLTNSPHLTRERLERTKAKMNAAVRDCLVENYEPLIATLDLPDADDRHVLASAIVSARRNGLETTVVFHRGYKGELFARLETIFADVNAQINWGKDEIASKSGVGGTLARELTPRETRLFADRQPALTTLPMRYATVKLTLLDNRAIIYATHSNDEGKFEIFAPPGRYLLVANDLNAARNLADSAYIPLRQSETQTIEIEADQFATVALKLRDSNSDTKSATP